MMPTGICSAAARSSRRPASSGQRARDGYRRALRRRRVRHSAARKRGGEGAHRWRARLRDRIARYGFSADRGPGNRADRLDWGGDAARCGRYCGGAAAGGRRGDVSREGHRARMAYTSPAARPTAPPAVEAEEELCVDPSIAVFAVFQRSRHRSWHCQHLRLCARQGHRRQRAVHRRHQQGHRPHRGRRQGSEGDARAARPATSSPSSR